MVLSIHQIHQFRFINTLNLGINFQFKEKNQRENEFSLYMYKPAVAL
jgi:hypothetical protein